MDNSSRGPMWINPGYRLDAMRMLRMFYQPPRTHFIYKALRGNARWRGIPRPPAVARCVPA